MFAVNDEVIGYPSINTASEKSIFYSTQDYIDKPFIEEAINNLKVTLSAGPDCIRIIFVKNALKL